MQNGQMSCPQGRESARYDAPSYLQQAKDTTTLGWDNVSTYVLAIKKKPVSTYAIYPNEVEVGTGRRPIIKLTACMHVCVIYSLLFTWSNRYSRCGLPIVTD